jgi:hypothetical protein
MCRLTASSLMASRPRAKKNTGRLIDSQAVARKMTLVTNHERELEPVRGLYFKNWSLISALTSSRAGGRC